MEFRKHVLDNGLQVVAECNADAYSTGLGFFVQTGSRDEEADEAGVSHFLEHMAFKGTPTRSADDVNREFDEMGAHYNAYTSEENTVYYAAVLPECQSRSVDLLADILRPSLREADFETEKKVIVEEIRMYEDQPPYCADDRCKAVFFGDHPLGHSVLGTVESVTALTAQRMRKYFESRYSPGNIVLAAAGKVDFDQLVAQAELRCGAWEPVSTARKAVGPVSREAFELECRAASAQQYVLQLMQGPAAADEDRFAAKLLATIVGDDSGSRLYWELVDPGIAEHASLGHYEYDGAGVYMAYMSCRPEKAEENVARMQMVYRQLQESGITADELAQAKSKLKSRVVLSGERPRSRLFAVGVNWGYRREYRSVRDDLVAIGDVSIDNVHDVLRKYPLTVNTTLTVGPLKKMARAS